ncbi:MAG: RNA polymerase sigma factor [Acidobacteriota bacterium]|nr:RNA polymerase sigma factor [Acidobacteriota bacterium]
MSNHHPPGSLRQLPVQPPTRTTADAQDDATLLSLVNRAGQVGWTDAAFEPLFRRYHPRLLGFFRRRLDRLEIAEELVQEVLLNVARSSATFASLSLFEAWLTEIAHNVLRNHRRASGAQKRQGLEVPAEQLEGSRAETQPLAIPWMMPLRSPLDDVLASEEQLKVARALDLLPPAMRNVAVLRFTHDRKYEEIAGILGASVNTVKSQLHAARRRLADLLGGKT